MLPYSFVELPSFKQLMFHQQPLYKIPSRATFSEQIIPAKYKLEKQKLFDVLRSVDSVAITTDGWTSRTTTPFNTITVHYVDKSKDWSLKSKVLQMEKMLGSHTGENLATELEASLANWGIQGKLSLVTTDNAANIG